MDFFCIQVICMGQTALAVEGREGRSLKLEDFTSICNTLVRSRLETGGRKGRREPLLGVDWWVVGGRILVVVLLPPTFSFTII